MGDHLKSHPVQWKPLAESIIACELAQTHKLQSPNVGDVEAQEDNLPCNATPSEQNQG